MTILKQSQEESAKIAMDHHRQSMSALLSELKADNQTQFQSLVDKETAHLQEQLDASDKELQTSRLRVVELESLAQELESEVSAGKELCETLRKKICQLQEDLEQSRKGWPPSMHQFEALIQQIRDLETSAKKRESEIETLISLTREDAASAYEEDRLELVRLLAKKDQEILGFKGEVDSMVSSILQLKRSGVIL